MQKIRFFLPWLPICLATIILSACASLNFERNSSDHAKFIPKNAWFIATIRPGAILEKMDYGSFVHMPAIAYRYSTGSLFESIDSEDQRELDLALHITRMIEDPSESGIELEEDCFFFAGETNGSEHKEFIPPMPTFGFVLPLADHEKFETVIELIIEASRENDEVRRTSRDDLRLIEHEHWILAIADGMAFFKGSITENSLKADDIVTSLESPHELEPALSEHLSKPFDMGAYIEMEGYFDWIMLLTEDQMAFPEEVVEQMKEGTFTYEITGEDGQLTVKAGGSYGDPFPYDFTGEGVGDAILGLLPRESIASATISLNMESVRNWLHEISGNLGDLMDMPPMDEPIEELGLTPDEALSAFSGDFAVSLIDLPSEDAHPRSGQEMPEFVLAIETVDPAGKIYQKILKNKLLALFDQNARNSLQALGISLVAKNNLLIIGSRRQAELLKSGKAPNPVGGEERKLLADGYMNVILDFEKLVEALPFDNQELDVAEEIALLGLGKLDELFLQSTIKDKLYEVTISLSLKNKKTNFFKQLATFVGNILDPAWREPKHRTRIIAATTLAKEKPDHFRKGLVGAWKSKWTDEESEGEYTIYKFVNKEDGTFFQESMSVSEEGYQLDEYKGNWKVVGSSYLSYDENGLLDWVGGILEMDDEKIEYYDIWESFGEFEVNADHRVPDDWALPDPPEGLRNLMDEGSIEEEIQN